MDIHHSPINYECDVCKRVFSHARSLRSHLKAHTHQSGHSSKLFSCWTCNRSFVHDHSLLRHRKECHRSAYWSNRKIDPNISLLEDEDETCNSPFNLLSPSLPVSFIPLKSFPEVNSPHLKQTAGEIKSFTSSSNEEEIFEQNYGAIESYYKSGNYLDILNVRIDGEVDRLRIPAKRTYKEKISTLVKVNASPGFILKHKTTGELRYYHSSANNLSLFDKPQLVSSSDQFQVFMEKLLDMDILEQTLLHRPNTSWVVHRLTNISIYFYKLRGSGCVGAPDNLPDFLRKHKYVLTLEKDRILNKKYTDNLCFFRALSIVKNCSCKKRCRCSRASQRCVKDLYNAWMIHQQLNIPPESFSGICLKDLLELETLFGVSIKVFSLKENDVGSCIWSSNSSLPTKLNLCLHENHFCLVKNVASFAKSFVCENCDSTFSKASNLNRHNCQGNKERFRYPSGCYRPPATIFDSIEERIGLQVDKARRIYPYRITYDIESLMDQSNLPDTTSKLEFLSEHRLMSVSVCSNVPGFCDPKFFVSKGSTNEVILQFVSYMEQIQEEASGIMREKFRDILEKLDEAIDHQGKIEKEFCEEPFSNKTMYAARSISSLKQKFLSYLAVIPVIGFNSGSYDLNIMKGPLLKFFNDSGRISFVIKRDSKLQCIQTDRFKFLDMMNYLTPGTSYAKYLRTFEVSSQKGFFPYDYITSLDKLQETSLPPHAAFYNRLKKTNISDEDYRFCQQVWQDNQMKTLTDFLQWYNDLDVKPFLEAIDRQMQIYKTKDIDMFKDHVSIPGVAVKWKFHELEGKSIDIPLINYTNRDLFHAVKQNIVGGPSIIFKRYHEKDHTKIRQHVYGMGAQDCQYVVGYDANALYLWSMMQDMPTGSPIRRFADNNFLPKLSDKYGRLAWTWMEYEAMAEGVIIQHKFNAGEYRVGQHGLPVDGYCSATNTVSQFHGCSFHGHNCHLTKNQSCHPFNGKCFAELAAETEHKENYVKSLGYKLVVMRECEWYNLSSSIPEINSFCEDLQHRTMSKKNSMTEAEILDSMQKDQWFGLIECDISVPDHLYDKFSEMSPIFKNIPIGREHLTGHMKDFVMQHESLKHPQRILIGSMFGKQVLLMTPLAKFYLIHGMEITKIYQIVQYKPEKCFEAFGKSVSEARREGDIDPSKSLLADTCKLIGNSVYGKMITNKEKHKKISYHSDTKMVSHLICRNEFVSLEEIEQDFYEVLSDKKSQLLDVPVILGFCILQYAKLRMLQFYYDCIDKYIDRRDFEYCEMDTDSAYMALSNQIEHLRP